VFRRVIFRRSGSFLSLWCIISLRKWCDLRLARNLVCRVGGYPPHPSSANGGV